MTLRTVLLAGAAVALLASAGCHKKPVDPAASDSAAAASDTAASMTAASDAAMAPASK
jgi:hypothetical protein